MLGNRPSPASSFDSIDRNLFPVSWQYGVTPRITIGYEKNNGLGVRCRYWNLDQTSNVVTASIAPGIRDARIGANIPADIEFATNTQRPTGVLGQEYQALSLSLVDLQITWSHYFDNGVTTQFFSGLRYAKTDVYYDVRLESPFWGVSTANYLQSFEGVGPSIGTEVDIPFGVLGLSFYTWMQGTVLVGSGAQLTERSDNQHQPGDQPIVKHRSLFSRARVVLRDGREPAPVCPMPGGDYAGGGTRAPRTTWSDSMYFRGIVIMQGWPQCRHSTLTSPVAPGGVSSGISCTPYRTLNDFSQWGHDSGGTTREIVFVFPPW